MHYLLKFGRLGQLELSVELSHTLPDGLHLLYVDIVAVRGTRHADDQVANGEVLMIRVNQQDVFVPDGASWTVK